MSSYTPYIICLVRVVAGLLFMVYPYFVDSLLSLTVVGAIIGIALWAAVRGGW